MSEDRLTRLPDTVLWQILSHAPAKEAVRTSALSRPWRSVWLWSGVLNLDSRSYAMCSSRRLNFLRDANAALDAIANNAASNEGSGLKKLTFTYLTPDNAEHLIWSQRHVHDGLDALLTGTPVAHTLKEIHVHISPPDHYGLRVVALPSYSLRVLHLDGLDLYLTQSSSFLHLRRFPRLETLRLRRCVLRLTDIQVIMDVAPLLATLELDRVNLYSPAAPSGSQLLRCPQITAISLANLRGWSYRLEIDAPSLRYFAYKEFGGVEVLNVSLEQPGAQHRVEQVKELNLRIMKDALLLRL